jgi:hypothetical protein
MKETPFGNVEPTPDSEPMYSTAVHTPEMWEKIGRFLTKMKVKDVKKWVGSKGTN